MALKPGSRSSRLRGWNGLLEQKWLFTLGSIEVAEGAAKYRGKISNIREVRDANGLRTMVIVCCWMKAMVDGRLQDHPERELRICLEGGARKGVLTHTMSQVPFTAEPPTEPVWTEDGSVSFFVFGHEKGVARHLCLVVTIKPGHEPTTRRPVKTVVEAERPRHRMTEAETIGCDGAAKARRKPVRPRAASMTV